MSDPLVSIVLPTYNGSRYLASSIESCLAQTYENWELIIVDDASTDDTPAVIAEYVARDARIRCIRHETNRKLPAALNTGFAHAQGDLLTWTSDDNLYRPLALQTMTSELLSEQTIDMVYTNYTTIDDFGHEMQHVKVGLVEDLLMSNCVGPCFLYRRKVLGTIGKYAEDRFLAEDYDYWLRVSAEYQMKPLCIDCYLYRVHSKNLSTTHFVESQLAGLRVLLQQMPNLPWPSEARLGRAYLRIGVRLALLGEQRMAIETIAKAFLDYDLLSQSEDVENILLYMSGKLIDESRFNYLLSLLPPSQPGMRDFIQRVCGRFHAVKCYEAYSRRQRDEIRRHAIWAVRIDPRWTRNRGFVRIALWAYLGV